jgi:hypothetical protein
MAKMIADDGGGLIMRDHFSKPVVLGERPKNKISKAGHGHTDKRDQQQEPGTSAEIELVFQKGINQEYTQYGSKRDQAAANQLIEVISSCESIQFPDEKIIIASLPHVDVV